MIDILASEPQYRSHVASIAVALGVPILEPGADRNSDAVLVTSHKDLLVARSLGYTRFARMEHGIGQSYGGDPASARNPGYAGGSDHDDVGLFLAPNAHAGDRWAAAYPQAMVAVVGCPKLDALPIPQTLAPVPQNPTIALSFHFDGRVARETRSAFGEYRAVLADLSRRYTMIGHAHPRLFENSDIAEAYRQVGIEVVRDFAQVLERADLYACDNSSTLYEAAAAGLRVVTLNSGWYRRNVHHGLRFWTAIPGLVCDRPHALVRVIAAALEDPPEAGIARRAALEQVYSALDGKATERAIAAIESWVRPVSRGIGSPRSVRWTGEPVVVGEAGPELVMPLVSELQPPKVAILVPRRAGIADRDATWGWVRQWWRDRHPDWPVVEGHHDIGPFNRSAAVNRAAGAAGDWDVAVIIDADVLCDPDRVRQGVEKAIATGRMILPFDVRKDLNQIGSQRVMAGERGSWARYIRQTYTDMCSGVVIVTRKLWDEVHGFDETFVGWGFEDNAFAAACETFAGAPLVKMPGELWHLYHATAKEGKRGTATHQRNSARAARYLEARGDRVAILALRERAIASFEHHPTGIPRILHRVVPEAPNAQADAWWAAFADMHPDWELMTHRDPLDPADWPETAPVWDKCENGAQFADLIRLEALLRFGGVYVDQDVQPIRSLEPLLPLSAFAAWEDERTVPNAVMGAVAAHPAIRECLDRMLAGLPAPTWQLGPGVLTAVMPDRDDVLLLPPESFYPVHYRDPERASKMSGFEPKRHPGTFVLHHYWGSWLAKAEGAA